MEVKSVCEHSAKVVEGDLFIARTGTRFDGNEFAADAVSRGATGVLCSRPIPSIDVPQCVVPCVAEAFALICHALHGYPAARLPIVGVTGTDGKTTTCWLLRSILSQANGSGPMRAVALSGTIDIDDGIMPRPAAMTTPGPMEIAEWLGRAKSNGVAAAVMELSSHALDQKRAAGLKLDAAVVTNLGRDHLDYHPTEEAYFAAKTAIVDLVRPGGRVVLSPSAADFVLSHSLLDDKQVVVCGDHDAATASCEILRQSGGGLELRLRIGNVCIDVHSPLLGRHNAENILAAVVAATHLGASPEMIRHGVASVDVVPGRMEAVDASDLPFGVYVDYAHTPKAIETVVRTAQEISTGRVIAVCGAGGNRDVGKRPLMGAALAGADIVILTSDNPRDEDPASICEQIAAGIRGQSTVETIIDRQVAIDRAVALASDGDVVLVLGKGHEGTQRIGDDVIPFDDRIACADAIERRTALSPAV